MAIPSKKPWTAFGSREPKKPAPAEEPAQKPPKFSATIGPYTPGDPIPAAEATELNTDTTWALWSDLAASENRGFADTVPPTTTMRLSADERSYATTEPAPLGAQSLAARPPPRAKKVLTVDEAMVEARKNNRVCPLPARWMELYEMLPQKSRSQPTPPLVEAAWKATSSIPKRMCFREHIEWAADHGCLDKAFAFMKGLPEDEWLHMGD